VANLNNLGHAYRATHQYDLAITALTAARGRAAEAGHLAAESVCAHNLGCAFLKIGDTRRAIEIFQQVRAVSQRLGNPFGEAATLHRMGDAYRKEKQPDLAVAALQDALAIRERIGSVREQGLTQNELSAFHLETGDLAQAAHYCAAALAIHERIKDAGGRCDALITRADIERTLRSGAAVRHARVAVAAAGDLGDSYRCVHALAVLADALAQANSPAEAAHTRAEAFRILDELRGPDTLPLRARLLASPTPTAAGRTTIGSVDA